MRKVFNEIEGSAGIMLNVINAILEVPNGMNICDLMACEGSITGQLNVGKTTYVDVVKREIKGFRKNQDVFVLMDAIEYLKSTYFRFNAIMSLDGIEHINKKSGTLLLELMKQKSDRQIIFTPLGNYLVEEVKTDNPDSHKSGWTPEEFEKIGWATLVFPNFHPTLNAGAFFAFHCKDIDNEFKRVSAWCENIKKGLIKPRAAHEIQVKQKSY